MFITVMVISAIVAMILMVAGFCYVLAKFESAAMKGYAYIMLSFYVLLNMIFLMLFLPQ